MEVPLEAREAFALDVAAAAGERGITLNPDLVNRVYLASLAGGFNPDATRLALDHEVFGTPVEEPEPEYEPEPEPANPLHDTLSSFAEANAEEAARRAGRTLTGREQAALRASAERGAERGDLDPDHLRTDAGIRSWSEMSDREQARVMTDRFRDQVPDPRESPDREFDMTSDRDWVDYAAARVRGEEFQAVDEPEAA